MSKDKRVFGRVICDQARRDRETPGVEMSAEWRTWIADASLWKSGRERDENWCDWNIDGRMR